MAGQRRGPVRGTETASDDMGESDLDESNPDDSELPDGDVREEIQKFEHRIEELAETIEGCRKFLLMSKIAIAVGGLLSLAMAFGVIWFDATVMIAANRVASFALQRLFYNQPRRQLHQLILGRTCGKPSFNQRCQLFTRAMRSR